MRIIGAFIIIVSAVTIALELIRKIDVSIGSVSSLRMILEHTKNMIECYSLPVGEIFIRLDFSLLKECGFSKKNAPRDFLELAENSDIPDFEAKELLLAFAKDFGRSYRADELSRCSFFLEKMRAREQKLIKESAKSKKVIFTVAICSALALIILII